MAVLAGILDTEELQALVVLVASASHRGEFVAPTAIERGCRSTLLRRAPAIAPATPTAALARASRCGAFRGDCGATALTTATFATSAAATPPSASGVARLSVVGPGRTRRLAALAAGGVRPAAVGCGPHGRPHAIPGGQRLVVGIVIGIVIGKSRRFCDCVPRLLAAVTVCLRPGSHVALTVTSTPPAAAAAAPSSSSPWRPVGIAVAVAGRFGSWTAVIVANRVT